MLAERVRLYAAVLWTGSLWTVGILASVFFHTLADRHLAGTLVGIMLHTGAVLGMACAVAILAARPPRAARPLVLAMLCCAMTIEFGLQPLIASLREQGATQTAQFGLLHAASVLFYGVAAVLGALLLGRVR